MTNVSTEYAGLSEAQRAGGWTPLEWTVIEKYVDRRIEADRASRAASLVENIVAEREEDNRETRGLIEILTKSFRHCTRDLAHTISMLHLEDREFVQSIQHRIDHYNRMLVDTVGYRRAELEDVDFADQVRTMLGSFMKADALPELQCLIAVDYAASGTSTKTRVIYQIECDGSWDDVDASHYATHDGSAKRVLYTGYSAPGNAIVAALQGGTATAREQPGMALAMSLVKAAIAASTKNAA